MASGSVRGVHDLDVVGIGNALVDVISHHDDGFLSSEGLVKGSMTLIEADRALALYDSMGAGVHLSGGSAANTMTGVASFGGRAGYIGKVAADDLGDVFRHDLRAVGVTFVNAPSEPVVPTGRCLIVVTPDAQRTMNTFLGVSALLVPEDVDETLVARASVVYLEGYLFDRDGAKEAYRKASTAAHAAGGKVSLTLSDSFCVDRHRDDFRDLVAGQVDVLFCNEDELMALYETSDVEDALDAVRRDCEVAAVTRGKDGSVVVTPDGVVPVTAHPVVEVVDTTGAGDLYAAGFLYGLTHGRSLGECGRLGSVAAAEVIAHVGARPNLPLRRLA
jgi:sugar/nucleoside kinase (ribokinase family)